MKGVIYCYRDVENGFTTLYVDTNDNSAMRGFAYAVNREGLMNFRPNDYALYRLGMFDSDTGEITVEKLQMLCSGGSVIDRGKKE